jgi:Zn-dependent peptidase ImmA (M78 family)
MKSLHCTGPTDAARIADDYASDMLLPRSMLEPMLKGMFRPALKNVCEVADLFEFSITATMMKILETNRFPMMVVFLHPARTSLVQAITLRPRTMVSSG